MKCPQCGAELSLHHVDGQAAAFCEYCGGKIVFSNEQKKYDVNNGVIIQESNASHVVDNNKKESISTMSLS